MPVKEKKTSRAEFAYDTLKRRILDNQLPPGAMLSEVALAQKLNMSRTPIREALKMLMRDDLVEIRDGVGTFVKSATQKDIEDAYAVRQALEVLAARTAIGAFSSEELDALEARFRSLQVRLEQGETVRVEEFADADWALHDQILQKSGNRYAQKATNDLRAVLRRYQYLSVRLLSPGGGEPYGAPGHPGLHPPPGSGAADRAAGEPHSILIWRSPDTAGGSLIVCIL